MKFVHDLHVHTVYSSHTGKKATAENYTVEAQRLGLRVENAACPELTGQDIAPIGL